MNLCIKIPSRLSYKRYNKKYAKLKYVVDHTTKTNTFLNSPQFVCGIKALSHGFLPAKLVHSCILLLRRCVGKGRIGWPRVRITFNLTVPITRKSEGHRMGKGKGPVRGWGVAIKAGSFVFKIRKSPRRMFFLRTFDWTNIYSFYEWLDTNLSIYDANFAFQKLYSSSSLDSHKHILVPFKINLLLFSMIELYRRSTVKFFKFFFQNTRKLIRIATKDLNKAHTKFKKSKTKLSPSVLSKGKGKLNLLNNFKLKILVIRTLLSLSHRFLTRSIIKAVIMGLKKKKNKKIPNIVNILSSSFYMMLRTSFLSYKTRVIRLTALLAPTNLGVPVLHYNPNSTVSFPTFYLDNKLVAEKNQRQSETKISYLPSLYRGLKRIKHKLPFKSELFFVDPRFDSFALHKSIISKRQVLRHKTQK